MRIRDLDGVPRVIFEAPGRITGRVDGRRGAYEAADSEDAAKRRIDQELSQLRAVRG